MYRKWIIPVVSALFFALFLLAQPAYAGGWATVGITEMPDQPQAQQPFELAFMVWQHGNKAVHEIYWDGDRRLALAPEVTFTSPETGQSLIFTAEPAKQPGLFITEVNLPGEGTWEWSIALEPLHNVTEMQPLTVLPAKSAAAKEAPVQVLTLFAANVPLLAVLAAAVFVGLLLMANRLRAAQQSG
jgi:hypothetical protein